MEGYKLKCENCNRETRGIKLNGKIFCTYCGEIVKDSVEILEEAYEHTPPQPSEKFETEPKRVSKDGEIITGSNEVELLGAEEKVLELLKGKNTKKIKKTKRPIIKSKRIIKQNRNRAGMMVVLGEPDPIEEPELEPPHDAQIESPGLDSGINTADEKTNFSLHDNQQKKEIPKAIKTHEALPTEEPGIPEEPKEEAIEITPSLKEAKKSIKKPKKHKFGKREKWLLIISAIIFALLSLTGLVYYVTNYATNEDYIEKKIETSAGVSHSKPTYITPGYKLSYLSDSNENFIEYKYIQITGSDSIVIRAEKAEINSEKIYDTIIEPQKTQYRNIKISEIDVWEVESNKIYFIKNDILYTITSSANLLSEIRKIAEGLIN